MTNEDREAIVALVMDAVRRAYEDAAVICQAAADAHITQRFDSGFVAEPGYEVPNELAETFRRLAKALERARGVAAPEGE